MFASRHQSSRPKSCQPMRAISTLYVSSNQNGLQARHCNRKKTSHAITMERVSQCAAALETRGGPSAVWYVGDEESSIVSRIGSCSYCAQLTSCGPTNHKSRRK